MTILKRVILGLSVAALSVAYMDRATAVDRIAQLPALDLPETRSDASVASPDANSVVPTAPMPPDALPPEPSAEQRDPMVPSAEILDLLQPKKADLPTITANQSTSATLPPLPRFRLTAIVLNSDLTGTAMIAIDTGSDQAPARSISLALGRQPVVANTAFPKRQFWKEKQVLDAIDDEIEKGQKKQGLRTASEPGDEPAIKPWLRLDGFEVEGVFFSVEEYTDKAILLRAYPHDTLLLVR